MKCSKLCIGNLDYSVTQRELEILFSQFGSIRSIRIAGGIGSGFVEMMSPLDAKNARQSLNGIRLKGKVISVDECRTVH